MGDTVDVLTLTCKGTAWEAFSDIYFPVDITCQVDYEENHRLNNCIQPTRMVGRTGDTEVELYESHGINRNYWRLLVDRPGQFGGDLSLMSRDFDGEKGTFEMNGQHFDVTIS